MTLDEIAKELGVSKSTVSRALSGKGRIGKETSERIRTYMREHGEENMPGVEAESGRTRNIGVLLLADSYFGGGEFFQKCLGGIAEAAALYQYNVMLITAKLNDISELKRTVEAKKIDGIVLTRALEKDMAMEYLTQMQMSIALTGTCKNQDVIQVDTDNAGAAERMTSMLIGRGFRKFAFLAKDMNFNVDKKRQEGFCKALYQNGIPESNQLFYSGSVRMEFLDTIISELIANKVECVVCGDDDLCTMIMSRLQAEGYRIPMDIAVASLYNSTNLECYSPAVTAVSVAAAQMGNLAARQLIQKLEGKDYEQKVMVDYDLLFRKSTN